MYIIDTMLGGWFSMRENKSLLTLISKSVAIQGKKRMPECCSVDFLF